MSEQDPVVIVSARRTPIGSFQGKLSRVAATALGAEAIRAAVSDAGLEGPEIDEVLMGCVLPAGLGQAPARIAALEAGLPQSVGAITVNKVCGSGMRTAMLGHDMIAGGSAGIVVAGGMESMTGSPYLLPKARGGYRMGHGEVLDHMMYDGLENPFNHKAMGHFAEMCAERYGFTREEQDAFARASLERSRESVESGRFADEVVPVTVRERRGEHVVDADEEPFKIDPSRIGELRPAFKRDGGTVTAASSSSISDGAAALVLMRRSTAVERGVRPLARVLGHSVYAQDPDWFTTSPVAAIRRLQDRLGWSVADVDLYEINEAFAVVAMAAMRDLEIPHAKVNVHGGACALGHPIGASGARITVTLLHALRQRGLTRGIASLCIGGGEATAIAVELESA
ncbi:MAG TPA: acetyl-CoA C-acyltransferase [Gammaproteobacteria bacterium]|nr:acetyl-CoA C-acyltransferase [Gammaproteobacteria bacterium]